MRVAFGDTLYWVAMTNPADQWHEAAVRATTSLGELHILTTEEVLVEFLNALAGRPHLRRVALERLRRIRSNPNVEVVPQTPQSFALGLALYEARPDKAFSLTDCISMAIMRQRGLTEALTRDHHFVQEGFTTLI